MKPSNWSFSLLQNSAPFVMYAIDDVVIGHGGNGLHYDWRGFETRAQPFPPHNSTSFLEKAMNVGDYNED